MAKGRIAPPVTAPVEPDVAIADCCGSPDPYRYIRINDGWHQFVWLPAPRDGNPHHHVAGAFEAVIACQRCGRVFTDKTTTRKWHKGECQPVDDMLKAIIERGQPWGL